jgi:hypothetical protein
MRKYDQNRRYFLHIVPLQAITRSLSPCEQGFIGYRQGGMFFAYKYVTDQFDTGVRHE